MASPSLSLTRALSTTPLPPQCLSWRCSAPPAVYAALNSLYNVDGGHRTVVFNQINGIKDKLWYVLSNTLAEEAASPREGTIRLRRSSAVRSHWCC